MSFLKYLSENKNGMFTADGFPVRGDRVPALRQNEYDNLPLSFDAHVKIFDLSREEDLKEYTNVLDHIANGLWIRLAPDREMEDKERRTWLVLCRWAEVKCDIPPEIPSL